jgi:predicted Zn-dependent peptidase
MPSTGFRSSRLDRRRLLTVTAAALAVTALRPAAPARGQTAGVLRRTLANGLVVIVDERRATDSLAVQLTARAGSRDDGMLPGVNALTSRLMFSGTRKYPSQAAIQRAAALVGGTIGRGAGTEQSLFGALVPAAEADAAFDLLAELALDPLLAEPALAALKQVTLQDLQQRRINPDILLGDLFLARMFAGHPAGSPPLGTMESIQALTRDQLAAHHGRYWNASNLVLTIVGNLDSAEAVARAERYFGAAPAGMGNMRTPVPPPTLDEAETAGAEVGQAQAQFRIGFRAPDLRADDRFPMTVLSALMSLRLFIEIRSERGLAYSAGAGYITLTDAGAWFAAAGTDPSTLEEALGVARAEILRLRDEGVSQATVDDQISQIVGRQVLADETNAARASRLAAIEVIGDVPVEEAIRRIRAVTAADVQRVARTYLGPDRSLTVVVGPPGV